MYRAKSLQGFPDSSVGKESACNAGDPSLILGLGRSAGEGIGYLLQYSWASLVVQLVKNLPAVREAWIQSLGWDDPLEKGFPLQYSGLENSMDYIVHGVAKSRTQLSIFHFHFLIELKADSLLSEPPGKPRKKQTYTSNRQSTRTYSMAQGTLLEIL